MQELKSKRTHNSKTFLNENGSFNLQAHSGVIHYFDKLDSKRFREIDWKLQEGENGWFFNFNSFRPLIPFYSDDWAEFRDLYHDKDQTIKYKAIGKQVKGEFVVEDKFNPRFGDNIHNGVLYKDVFGKGEDLMYYCIDSSMIKVAIINNPNTYKKDAVFEWEVEFPDKDIQRGYTKDKIEYKLDKTKDKEFDTDKKLMIGNDKKDGKEWFTYIEPFKAWDSGDETGYNTILVKAKLYHKGGKYILQKTIPLDFLQKAKGKVYTDDTNTTSTNNKDNYLAGNSKDYNATSPMRVQCRTTANQSDRALVQFTLPAESGTISDVDLKVTDVSGGSSNISMNLHRMTRDWTEGGVTYNKYDGTNVWTTAGGDYDSTILDTVSGLTVSAGTLRTFGIMGTNALNSYTLDWSDTIGLIFICNPEGDVNWYHDFATKEHATTSYRPYLSVTYAAAATETVTVSTLTLLGVG